MGYKNRLKPGGYLDWAYPKASQVVSRESLVSMVVVEMWKNFHQVVRGALQLRPSWGSVVGRWLAPCSSFQKGLLWSCLDVFRGFFLIKNGC